MEERWQQVCDKYFTLYAFYQQYRKLSVDDKFILVAHFQQLRKEWKEALNTYKKASKIRISSLPSYMQRSYKTEKGPNRDSGPVLNPVFYEKLRQR